MTVNLSSYLITHTTHPVWGKLPAILEAFEKYPDAEWVWWLDIDAIIMSPDTDLYTSFLSPSIIQSKLVQGESILILDDTHTPVRSGLLTTVCTPSCVKVDK
jgi:galactosyl transferase GMA12/MNN10 family